jgi:hypothetical protein
MSGRKKKKKMELTFKDIADDIIDFENDCGLCMVERYFCDYMQQIMEIGGGESLVQDDNGHWAIAGDGVQNIVAGKKPSDLQTSFSIKAGDFSDTIGGALVKWARNVVK